MRRTVETVVACCLRSFHTPTVRHQGSHVKADLRRIGIGPLHLRQRPGEMRTKTSFRGKRTRGGIAQGQRPVIEEPSDTSIFITKVRSRISPSELIHANVTAPNRGDCLTCTTLTRNTRLADRLQAGFLTQMPRHCSVRDSRRRRAHLKFAIAHWMAADGVSDCDLQTLRPWPGQSARRD